MAYVPRQTTSYPAWRWLTKGTKETFAWRNDPDLDPFPVSSRAQRLPAVPETAEESAATADAADEGSSGLAAKRRRRWAGRGASYALTVFFLVTLNFFLPRAMPGDPISTMVASGAGTGSSASVVDAELRQSIRRYYGLDKPLVVQYGRYLKDLGRGDSGCHCAIAPR